MRELNASRSTRGMGSYRRASRSAVGDHHSYLEAQESPYYAIDKADDLYSTTISATQRNYIDPWDLENYDYVRKKIEQREPSYSESPSSGSPIENTSNADYNYYANEGDAADETLQMEHPSASLLHSRKLSNYPYRMDCCNTSSPIRNGGLNDDYMMSVNQQFDNYFSLQNSQVDYGVSSTESYERHSSIDDDYPIRAIPSFTTQHYDTVKGKKTKPAPRLEFPAPPPLPAHYDYSSPYATTPCCNLNDCYECSSSYKMYSSSSIAMASTQFPYSSLRNDNCSSNVDRRSSTTTTQRGMYYNKFSLSKKGLLEIDYSCSWHDLDRVIGRNY